MKKASPSLTETPHKNQIRSILREQRDALTAERREEALHALTADLLPLLQSFNTILSFHSLPQEIDLTPINKLLAEEGKLLLPKVDGEQLRAYRVVDLASLVASTWKILEPNPSLCECVDLQTIDCILVPGLGFDANRHRIGYGKGHYDRLIAQCKQAPKTIGIGFKEQHCEKSFPVESHDIRLEEIRLF